MDRPPLSTRDRRALIAVAAQFFVNGAMSASFIARLPQIRDRLGVTVDRFGLLLTAAGVFGLVGSLLAGRIVHRLGTYRVLTIGAFVMVGSLPIIGLARNPVWYLIGMFAYAFVDVLVDISMNLQGSWLSDRRHTPVMNRLHGLWSLGTLLGGSGAVLANRADLGLPAHLGVVAAVAAVVLFAVTRGVLRTDQDGHSGNETGGGVLRPAATLRRARMVPLVLIFVAGLSSIAVEMTGGDWAAFRLADDFGASAAVASLAFVAFTIGMSALRLSGDSLQARCGRRRVHHWSIATASTGLVLASLVRSETVAVVGFALVGAGVATFMPTLYDDAARLPGRRGAGLGAMTAGSRVAVLVTPSLVGTIAGSSWSVGAAIAVVTLPSAIAYTAISELIDRRTRRR